MNVLHVSLVVTISLAGLASTSPGPHGKHGVVLTGGTAGTFPIYLDNLGMRHIDWMHGCPADVESLDNSLGWLLKRLDDLGLREKIIVVLSRPAFVISKP